MTYVYFPVRWGFSVGHVWDFKFDLFSETPFRLMAVVKNFWFTDPQCIQGNLK